MPEGIETSRATGDNACEQDVHDALADLFISDSFARVQAATQQPTPAADPVGVELVIPGHLPVRGSVWVRQFASAVATAEGGPVALLRAADGTLIAERVESPSGPRAVNGTAQTTGDVVRGSSAVLAIASEVDAFGLVGHESVVSVTVLTAANDAAIVHAYQVLKTIAFRLDERRGKPAAGQHPVTLGLAVVGESRDGQVAAFHRVERAVRSFLNRELVLRPGCERCEPVRSSARVEVVAPASAMLDIASRQQALTAKIRQPDAPEVSAETGRGDQQENDDATTAQPHHHRRRVPASRPVPTFPAALSPVAFRCPDAPDVTLGIDAEGRLHGVTRGRNVSELLAARRWARKHAELLALADPRLAEWSRTANLIGHAICSHESGTGTLIVTGERGHTIREFRPVMITDDD